MENCMCELSKYARESGRNGRVKYPGVSEEEFNEMESEKDKCSTVIVTAADHDLDDHEKKKMVKVAERCKRNGNAASYSYVHSSTLLLNSGAGGDGVVSR